MWVELGHVLVFRLRPLWAPGLLFGLLYLFFINYLFFILCIYLFTYLLFSMGGGIIKGNYWEFRILMGVLHLGDTQCIPSQGRGLYVTGTMDNILKVRLELKVLTYMNVLELG